MEKENVIAVKIEKPGFYEFRPVQFMPICETTAAQIETVPYYLLEIEKPSNCSYD